MLLNSLKQLTPDPANRRKHNPRNVAMLQEALGKVGAARSIVIDETGEILAGNGVVQAATALGLDKVQVVDVEGDTLVAVRRTGLTAEQKRELAIYDNRTAELAEWDWEQLAADQAAGLSLEPWWAPDELELPQMAGLTDPDAVPAERPTGIVAGDLFELGAHRLLCGDATAQADVARLLGNVAPLLMVTDPPYGVEYDPNWRNEAARVSEGMGNRAIGAGAVGKVANDDRYDWRDAWALFPGDVAYVWCAGVHLHQVAESLTSVAFELRSNIIWAKQHFAIGRGDYHWQHEPCWYAVRKGKTAHYVGGRKQSTLWQIDKPQKSETGHSAQKPIECMRRPIENNSGTGTSVYDPFIGSGTTIIAAEQLGRVCYAIEVNPSYCQVTIDRWEAFTGQRAVKAAEAIRA